MTVETVPVQFANGSGHKLHGIVHLPELSIRKRTAILLLSPGVKMRVAPHRLYRKMADSYSALGYPVLRFDFHGLGDSEGDVREPILADLYASIQVGRYVDDTICATTWMEETYGADRIVLAGLCGGAITGLLAARSDGRVAGLLGLGIPVILDAPGADPSRFLTQGELKRRERGYLNKLVNPKAWLRLLTFRSDYRVIWRIIVRKLAPSIRDGNGPHDLAADPVALDHADNTNPLFAPAFFQFIENGGRALFIFSGSDRLGWEFHEKFELRHKRRLEGLNSSYTIANIAQANHILSMPIWQQQMLHMSQQWLQEHFVE